MKRLGSVLLLVVLLCGLVGCGSEQSAKTEQEKPALQKIRVGVSGKDIKIVNVILAKELGLYAEEGLDVEFVPVANLNDGVTAVSMDKLDILPYGFVPSATFISKGTDVVIFGGTISEGSQAIVRPEDKGKYTSLESLRGKKIGFIRPETGQMVMKNKLREAGFDINKDMEFVVLDRFPSVAEAVKKGAIDIGFVNSGYGTVAEKQGLAVGFNVGQYAPNNVCCRQTTSRKMVNENKAALIKFQIANLRAYEIYLNNHAKTVEILTKYCGQDASYVETIMYNGVMKPVLDPCRNRIVELYEAMKKNGDIDSASTVKVTDHVDVEIYKTALDTMLKRQPDSEIYKKLLTEYQTNNF